MYKYVKKRTPEMIEKRFKRMQRPERPPFPYHPVKTHKWYVDRIKEEEEFGRKVREMFQAEFEDD